MREAITALVTIACLPIIIPLAIMAQIPGLRKIPLWIWKTFYEYKGEISVPLFIFFFFLFGGVIIPIILRIFFGSDSYDVWPPPGPDWNPNDDSYCTGNRMC